MSRRYIAVTTDIFEHRAFADETYSRRDAWLWLIANAAWKTHRVRMGNSMVELKRGQVVAARSFLAGKWGWGEKKVRLFLDFLTAENMIEKGQSKGRLANVVSICKYEQFQTGKTIQGPVEDRVEGRFGAGSGPDSTKDTKDTFSNPPTPQGGNGELLLGPNQAPKALRKDRLNVAPTYTDDFNAVWQAFPKNPNSSKQDAFRAWQKIPEAERPSILPAAKVYAGEIEEDSRKARGGKVAIAHLSTFLNKGTFRDKVQAPEAKPDTYARFRNLSKDEWRTLIARHANGTWMAKDLGPSPSSKHCLVPRDLIDELDLADKYNEAGFAVNRHHPNHPANSHA